MLAALASLETDHDMEELPEWASEIIVRINQPPTLTFEDDYSRGGIPEVDEDKSSALDSESLATVKFAKNELNRLCKRVV